MTTFHLKKLMIVPNKVQSLNDEYWLTHCRQSVDCFVDAIKIFINTTITIVKIITSLSLSSNFKGRNNFC